MITFELFPGVGDMLKKQHLETSFAGKTLDDALAQLMADHPHLTGELLDEQGQYRNALAFFINDQQVTGEMKFEQAIRDSDKITILPALAGG